MTFYGNLYSCTDEIQSAIINYTDSNYELNTGQNEKDQPSEAEEEEETLPMTPSTNDAKAPEAPQEENTHFTDTDSGPRTLYICPAAATVNCKWEGRSSSLLNHFREAHRDLVVTSNLITTDIRQDNTLNRLYVSDDEIFLLQTTFRASEAKLGVCLRYLGSPERATRISYSLEVDGTKNLGSYSRQNHWDTQEQEPIVKYINGKIEIEVSRISNAKDFLAFAVMVGEDVNMQLDHLDTVDDVKRHLDHLDTVDELTEENLDSTEELRELDLLDEGDGDMSNDIFEDDDPFILEDDAETPEMSEEDMIEMLKCVICRNQTLPPIHSCQNGHSLCEDCLKNECDVCGSEGGLARRNSRLEDVSRLVRYPCKFPDCKERFLLDELRYHEMSCKKVTYACPLCAFYSKFRSTWFEIRQHFKNIHPSVKVYVSTEIEISKGNDSLIMTNRAIFYCTASSQNSILRWRIVFCGPQERTENFACDLVLKGKGKKARNSGKVYPLQLNGSEFTLELKSDEMKKMQLQEKHAKIIVYDRHASQYG